MGVHGGLRFGTDAVFTYGPLGFLSITPLWFTTQGILSFAYQALMRFGLAAAFFFGARRMFGPVAGFLIAAVIASVDAIAGYPYAISNELVLGLFVAVWAITGRLDPRRTLIVVVAGGAFSGMQVLNKVSIGVSLAVMTVVLVLSLPGSRRRHGAAAAASFVVALAACWLLVGQPLGALPHYLLRSAQITLGYTSAMSIDNATAAWTYTAALIALPIGVWGALQTAEGASTRQRRGLVVLWVAFLFLIFKEGFVRQDDQHMSIFFDLMVGAPLAFSWRRGNRGAALLAVAAFVAFALSVQATSLTGDFDPVNNVNTAFTQLANVVDPGKRARTVETGRLAIMAKEGLGPQTYQLLAGRSVAVYPNELALAWAYGLDFRPLPVLQSYSAYTSALDRLDANFLASARAPQRILVQSTYDIDSRVLSFDEPQTIRTMLCRYRPVHATSAYEVLVLVDDRCAGVTPLATVHANWGQTVPVPAPPNSHSLVFVRIGGADVGGLESLASLLFKPAQRHLVLDGNVVARLVVGTAGDGLPLRAAAGVDFPAPYSIAPGISTIAVTEDGEPVSGKPLTFSFYAQSIAPLAGG